MPVVLAKVSGSDLGGGYDRKVIDTDNAEVLGAVLRQRGYRSAGHPSLADSRYSREKDYSKMVFEKTGAFRPDGALTFSFPVRELGGHAASRAFEEFTVTGSQLRGVEYRHTHPKMNGRDWRVMSEQVDDRAFAEGRWILAKLIEMPAKTGERPPKFKPIEWGVPRVDMHLTASAGGAMSLDRLPWYQDMAYLLGAYDELNEPKQ